MPDKKVMDIEASKAYLDHQISGMRQQKKTHDWIYNELKWNLPKFDDKLLHKDGIF